MELQTSLSFSSFWLPLATFIFVSSITPGPNNVMLTASGANFGYRRSVPHMLGISLGASAMLLVVGAGLGALLERMPMLHVALQAMGTVYLLWLAWKIATSSGMQTADSASRPLHFWQAAAFQWVNPKAWMMSVGVIAAYISPQAYWYSLLWSAAVMLIVNYPCISVWTLFGSWLRRWLHTPQALRRFNWGMAALLVVSLIPMLRPMGPA